jgi:hypothetical protein
MGSTNSFHERMFALDESESLFIAFPIGESSLFEQCEDEQRIDGISAGRVAECEYHLAISR